jgi:dipeptidyl aminopeptidase/acylaminoacyl peptidase
MNRKPCVILSITIAVGVVSSLSAQHDETTWTPERMLARPRISAVHPSPDGTQVVYVTKHAILGADKSEYRSQVHLAAADRSGSKQLTPADKSCDDPQWSPDGRWIAFVLRRGEARNLFVIEPKADEPQQLTELPTSVLAYKWSPNSRSIALVMKDPPTEAEQKAKRQKSDVRVLDENIKMQRLYVIPFETPVTKQKSGRLLTKDDANVAAGSRGGFDWSPDGKTIVFTHTRTPHADDWASADLSLVEVESGKVRPLVHTKAAEHSPHFSPDGKSIAYVASDDPPTWGGSGRVHVIPASGGKPRVLADTHDGFGRYSELLGWSVDGTKLYFSEIQGTRFCLMSMPLDGSPAKLGDGDGMSISGATLNASRKMIGYSWETPKSQPEAVVTAVDRFEPIRVSLAQKTTPTPPTEVIRWKSPDGLEVEGLLTYPAKYVKGKRVPLLVVIHGGPMGAFTQTFDGTATQYPVAAFASRGYAVLRPNPRGSSGYGKKFRYANYGDWGGGDYRDIMAGVDHVIALGVADPERMGVMGWSYGGFMTSWIITQTQRFKAASVGAGVTNLVSFTGTADIPGFLPDYFGGEFWNNLEPYRAHSAMFHVKGVKTPTLIQHGERDERVPISQGYELYNALKRQGCEVKMVVYPRTPHGIEEPRLLLDCMTRNLEWFEDHLRESLVPAGAKVEKVAGDCKFTEGPAADAAGNVFFSDEPNNRIMVIRPGGKVEVWTNQSQATNGMRFDAKGRLHTCCSEAGARAVVRFDDAGKTTIIADRFEGKRFNAPNDLVFDRHGRLYFTDPCYGRKPKDGIDKFAVYRIDADKGELIPNQVTRVIDDLAMPNGIAISPDNKTLYVADSFPGGGGPHQLVAYDLAEDGSCKRRAVLHDFGKRRGIDGMVVDTEGNIWATAETGDKTGVYIFSPKGKQLGFVPTPETATNCVFGDADRKTLYITAGRSVYRVRTDAAGWPEYGR